VDDVQVRDVRQIVEDFRPPDQTVGSGVVVEGVEVVISRLRTVRLRNASFAERHDGSRQRQLDSVEKQRMFGLVRSSVLDVDES
jgi:hypothetical protein